MVGGSGETINHTIMALSDTVNTAKNGINLMEFKIYAHTPRTWVVLMCVHRMKCSDCLAFTPTDVCHTCKLFILVVCSYSSPQYC